MKKTEKIEENYRGVSLKAFCDTEDDGSKFIHWQMWEDGKIILNGFAQIDGTGGFQNIRHAMNDAKKNVDSIYRMSNDRKKYEKMKSKMATTRHFDMNRWFNYTSQGWRFKYKG